MGVLILKVLPLSTTGLNSAVVHRASAKEIWRGIDSTVWVLLSFTVFCRLVSLRTSRYGVDSMIDDAVVCVCCLHDTEYQASRPAPIRTR